MRLVTRPAAVRKQSATFLRDAFPAKLRKTGACLHLLGTQHVDLVGDARGTRNSAIMSNELPSSSDWNRFQLPDDDSRFQNDC